MRSHWSSRPGAGAIMNAERTTNARAALARVIETGVDLSGATCATTDPELWYPELGAVRTARTARKLCSECPVRRLCLERAIESSPYLTHYGIWAGYTSKSLSRMRTLRKALRRAPVAPPPTIEQVHHTQAA